MTTIENFLSAYSQSVQDMAFKLRAIVRDVIADPHEQVNSGYKAIEYGSGDKMRDKVVFIAAFKDSVNLGFYNGTSLPDPNKMLRGTGKNLRHVKFKAGDSIDSVELRTLIAAAWGKDQKSS